MGTIQWRDAATEHIHNHTAMLGSGARPLQLGKTLVAKARHCSEWSQEDGVCWDELESIEIRPCFRAKSTKSALLFRLNISMM